MKYLFIILVLLSSLGHSQKCEDRVEEIFNDLVEGIGNNSIYPPSLEFSDDERAVATMGDFTITVERKVINLFCGQENFDDKMAYILGHEMAHHYIFETYGDDFYHHHHKLWKEEMKRVGFKGKITKYYGRYKTKEGE